MIEIKHIFFQCISKLMSSKQLFSSSDVNYIDIVLPRPLLRGWDISFVFVLVFRFQLFCVFTHYLLFRSGAGFRPICLYSAAVLVNRVYRTPQGVPEFSRGVPPRWGVQGCTICVFSKNSHIASHSMFFALAQCANISQALKSYTGECELSLLSRLFVGNVGQVTITYPS